MKDKVEKKLEELIKQRLDLEQAFQRTIGAIAVCQELLKDKESENVSNEV